MDIEIKVPALGESESEATLVAWHKAVGDVVAEDDVLAEIESDKITMEVTAIAEGTLREIRKQSGETVAAGEIIGLIEKGASPEAVKKTTQKKIPKEKSAAGASPAADTPANERREQQEAAKKAEAVKRQLQQAQAGQTQDSHSDRTEASESHRPHAGGERSEERVPMSALRKTIARRLKQAQNTAAILTTFNEVNMQPVMDMRSRFRDAFREKHGVNLGFMSFFVQACVAGLRRFPVMNACIEDEEIVYRNYQDIGIAVSTERGLVVPILRDAGVMSLAEIERGVAVFADKARSGALAPDDLKGGTFSITNGGVFGSLLSTPILNPPQSAILGMHAIQQRPVAENGQVVVRPMMYIALSYDHRIIDGREAVQFLAAVKEWLEFPGRDLLDL